MLSKHIHRRNQQLMDFGELELNLKGIRLLNRVPQNLHFISQLYLDGNHLLSLAGIQQFLNLQVLHFDYNYISLPAELNRISNPFFMKELSFIANPIQKQRYLTLEKLRQNAFTRLIVLNPSHPLSSRGHLAKQKQLVRQFSSIDYELTERRQPCYRNEAEVTSRKQFVGRIRNNRLMKTVKPSRKRQQTMSRDTRQSTVQQQSLNTFHKHNRGDQITPFDLKHQRDQVDSEEVFEESMEQQSSTARFDGSSQKKQPSERFLQDQKYHLASLFYRRTLLERVFLAFKKQSSKHQNLDEYEGQVINHCIESLKYSLIKLKHEAFRR